jgi:hypothetical protein
MAHRIAHEDCRLLVVGDSNALKTNNHRIVGGICRTWQPDQFVGRVSPGIASSDEGIKVLTSLSGLHAHGRAIYHAPTNDPHVWSNGQDGFIPNRAWDMVATGTGLSSNALYCTAELTRLDEYPGGDWTLGATMQTRLIFAHDQTSFSELRYRARRGPVGGSFTTFSPHDDATRPWLDTVDAIVPAGDGSIYTEVRTPDNWTSDNQGGAGPCPDNCTAGRSLFHAAQLIWRTDVPGLQVDSISEGGFTVADHLDASHYDDDALEQYLSATRNPNLFVVLLGQNMNQDEVNDIGGLWKAEVLGVLDRYRTAALNVDPTCDPMFVLVSPWSTNDASDRFLQITTVMADIATSRVDTGFINLHLLAGAHRYLDGPILFDGYHPGNDAAADLFTGLMWDQFDRELQGLDDIVINGAPQDLSTLSLNDDTVIHIANGAHTGPLHIDGFTVDIRGWDELYCSLTGTTLGPAVHASNGATVSFWRLGLGAGAGVAEADGTQAGGTIFVDSSAVRLTDVTLSGGEVHRGGAIAARDATLIVEGCAIQNGTAVDSGGLIDAIDSTVGLHDVFISGGAASYGGGLNMVGGTLQCDDVSLRECTADIRGGGCSLYNTSGDIAASHIRTNTAGDTAGGLWIEMTTLTLADTVICGNNPDDVVGDWTDGGGNIIGGPCQCPSDLNDDGTTDVSDLLQLLSFWGSDESGGDVNGDGITNVEDLLALISGFGPCI